MVANRRLASMILWGPPGCGKTTIARLLAQGTDLAFEPLSAVFSGVADLRKIFDGAKKRREMGQGTLLFVDEIHRFNRAQQDAFLPYVEDGTVILVGATTENPSFELNGALLSRAQVFVLRRLDDDDLETLLRRAEQHLGHHLPLIEDGRAALRAMADGDGRFLLNLVEEIERLPAGTPLGPAGLAELVQRRAPLYDKAQEGHYNLISALHKSLRGSDTDAALYWLARMLAGGEDPIYILRRLTRAAVEDIGLADPQAVVQALAAWDTYDRLGSPEGELAVAQLVIYLATAPKSNAAYTAFGEAMGMARKTGSLMPPKHILNAPTRLMRDLGYGKGYVYDHATDDAFSGQNYFPEGIERGEFYHPDRARLRARDQEAAGILGETARERAARRRRMIQTITVATEDGTGSGSTAGSAGITRNSRMGGSKSCCAPGRCGSTASAPSPATGCRTRPGDPRAAARRRAAAPPRASRARARPQDEALLRDAVIYRDDWAVVIDKPAGLAVQGGTNTDRHVDQLLDGLRFDSDERPRLVHRLDKDTSGVLLIARTAGGRGAFHPRLSRQDDAQGLLGDRRRRCRRCAQGRIDLALAKGSTARGGERVHADDDGKDAVTYYTVIDQRRRAGELARAVAADRAARTSCARIARRSARRSSATASMAAPARISAARCGAPAASARPRARNPTPRRLHAEGYRPLAVAYAADVGVPRLCWRCAQPARRIGSLRVKRVYKSVEIRATDAGWGVALDGKPLRTPAKRDLLVPSERLAAAIAAEWDAQDPDIRPKTMPLTRLAATTIDRTADQRDQTIVETANFAATDLVCYRADHPPALAERQHAAWQPLIDWAAGRYDAGLTVTAGIVPVAQSPVSLKALHRASSPLRRVPPDRAAHHERRVWIADHRPRPLRRPARRGCRVCRLTARRNLPDRSVGRRRGGKAAPRGPRRRHRGDGAVCSALKLV